MLPGVGAFADCKQGLARIPGMIDALEESVRARGKPFLGICVGLQFMATRGLEHGVTPGLGWIEGEVSAIGPSDATLKIPHMGWNTLRLARAHALFDGIPTGEGGLNAYFVHSYHLVPADRDGSSPAPTMAARSPRSSPRTTWQEASSTPRRARSSGLH